MLETVAVVCVDEFNVYTREAGAGNVSVSIEGPSKAKIEMVDRKCGYVTVGYVVSKPGNDYMAAMGMMGGTSVVLKLILAAKIHAIRIVYVRGRLHVTSLITVDNVISCQVN